MHANKMEILAPAGTKDALIAAVRAGADAVYFGAGNFNARRRAANFSLDELSGVVSYCHAAGVKCYLTLNTLVRDSEITDALATAKSAANAGIDGIIIQDLGLASLIRKASPQLPLHASTQCSVHTKSGVEYFHRLGFKRVVLARELSKAEIEDIAQYANEIGIELELFVQGAVCMSVSGQCLFSAVLGGRSGNRGMCAGPCRLPFSVKGGNGYDLSLKDMNLYRYFNDFKKIGIASLKIEGRLKTPEYSAAAVDAALSARNNSPELESKTATLSKVFSRSGFSDGYYKASKNADMFGTRSDEDVGLTKSVKNSIHELYRKERQSVEISIKAQIRHDEKIKLFADDGKNFVSIISDECAETAFNIPTDAEFIKSKLTKCGGTVFKVKQCDIEIDDGLCVKASIINALKTELLQKLYEKRAECRPYEFVYPDISLTPKSKHEKKIYAIVNDILQLTNKEDADLWFIPLYSDIDTVKYAINKGFNIAVRTPAYFFGDEKRVADALFKMASLGIKYAMADNIGAVSLIKKFGMKIVAGTGLNVLNSYCADFIKADEVILSAETDETAISKISTAKPIGIFAYGRLPLMLLRTCPAKSHGSCGECSIKDRKTTFPLMCTDGATRLYNDRPLYIGDKPSILGKVDITAFYFTDETPEEIENIFKAYKTNSSPSGDFTRGMLFRPVE